MNDESPSDEATTGSVPADPTGRRAAKLTASACWELLESTALGRLALNDVEGRPDIFPVNFTAHQGSLYLRTARDAKLLHIAHHPTVAFEIDGNDGGEWWSVVVRGRAERVTREDDIRESGVRALPTWSPHPKHYVVRITAETVTGRRFPAGVEMSEPFRFDETRRRSAAESESRHHPAPPQIPHLPPKPH